MKRLLSFVAVILFAGASFAAAVDRDVLITANGTVYSIASVAVDNVPGTSLELTVQANGKSIHSTVPESIGTGVNSRPTLGYDVDSDTLFVLWMHLSSLTTSELMVAAYQNGQWQPAFTVDKRPALRFNLSVALTHHVQQVQRDGQIVDAAALVLHAAWWEQNNGGSDGARYAIMGVRSGAITDADLHDMTEFLGNRDTTAVEPQPGDGFLHHVAILDGPTPDAVDVLFADPASHSFYRTTLKPIADARVRIPVGAHPGPRLGLPHALATDWTGRTGTISSRDGKTVIFCNSTGDTLSWVKYSDGTWSSEQHIALNETLTAEMAMSALAKMLAAAE